MRTLVINSSHYVANSGNQFTYNLPSSVAFNQGDKVALAGLNLYNATFNITAARGNNTVTVSFPSWTNYPTASQSVITLSPITSGTNQFMVSTALYPWLKVGGVFSAPFNSNITAISYNANYTITTLTVNTNFTASFPVGVGAQVTYSSGISVYSPYTPATPLIFPDGFYTYTQIVSQIQAYMFAQGLYLLQAGNPVYLINMAASTPTYGSTISFTELPTTTQLTAASLTIPTAAVFATNTNGGLALAGGILTQNGMPTINFSAGFGSLLGFGGGPFTAIGSPSPAPAKFATVTISDTLTPMIAPVNSYIMTCSLLNSPYSSPHNVFYTVPLSVGLSNIIVVSPSQFIWNEIAPNIYNQIVITFYDQLFNRILLMDTQITITLAIKELGRD